ncbi:MAG: RICIN domain-containing protein, partial [Mucilaginibacter sp.]
GVKYYHIRNSFSGKVLDVPGGTNVSGTQLQQYAEWPLLGDQQLWRITEIGTSGQYNIISKATGLAVSVAGGSTANGAAIIEETPNGNNRQKWVFSLRTASTYRDDVANRFFNRNGTSQGSTSFDQGNSLPLTWSSNNGKVLWITQDAYDGASLQPNSMFNCGQWFSYGNSMFLQPNINDWGSGAPNITRNGNKQIIDKQGSDTFAWPSAAVEIGQHVYVHVGEGSGLAMSNQSLWDLTQSTGSAWTGVRTTPAGMSGQTNIGYAVGMVKRPDNYVYAFGAQATGFGYSSNIHVARFPVGNPQSWSFWNGSGWVSTPVTGNGARVADALGSSSVAFVNNKYVLMTMDQGFNCDATRNIYISTSANPTGPFTTRVKVWTVQEYINGNYARYYTPIIHPEHVNGRNELLLTYSLNYDACGQGSCSGAYLDPYYYRLKCIRVPYSKIGL